MLFLSSPSQEFWTASTTASAHQAYRPLTLAYPQPC